MLSEKNRPSRTLDSKIRPQVNQHTVACHAISKTKCPGMVTGAVCLEWALFVGFKALSRWRGRGNNGTLSLN